MAQRPHYYTTKQRKCIGCIQQQGESLKIWQQNWMNQWEVTIEQCTEIKPMVLMSTTTNLENESTEKVQAYLFLQWINQKNVPKLGIDFHTDPDYDKVNKTKTGYYKNDDSNTPQSWPSPHDADTATNRGKLQNHAPFLAKKLDSSW